MCSEVVLVGDLLRYVILDLMKDIWDWYLVCCVVNLGCLEFFCVLVSLKRLLCNDGVCILALPTTRVQLLCESV